MASASADVEGSSGGLEYDDACELLGTGNVAFSAAAHGVSLAEPLVFDRAFTLEEAPRAPPGF